jgi:hypothetical protein
MKADNFNNCRPATSYEDMGSFLFLFSSDLISPVRASLESRKSEGIVGRVHNFRNKKFDSTELEKISKISKILDQNQIDLIVFRRNNTIIYIK